MEYFVEKFDYDKKKLNVTKKENSNAKTPLELAILNNQIDVVKILCNALDFNKKEKANLVSSAVSLGHAEIVEYLFGKFDMNYIL